MQILPQRLPQLLGPEALPAEDRQALPDQGRPGAGGGRVSLPSSVAPNGEVTFDFTVTAPPSPGAYNFQWRMVQDGVAWFGDYTTNLAVTVSAPPAPRPNDAQGTWQSVPRVMTAGQSYAVTVKMKNTGTSTWTSAGQYNLGSQNPQDNGTWGVYRAALSATTAPGAEATFSFTVTAPTSPGTYDFRWRMVQDWVEWFGDYSTNVAVTVNAAGGGGGGGVRWLVTDQLGTPRMVVDEAGSLAGMRRHDYLPFGEEVGAGTGGRTTGRGYSQVDNVRQKFSSKERDDETGMDYFGARYYASVQGRFTAVDPAQIKDRHLSNPQDLNRYVYVANNPLAFIDPDGEEKIRIIIRTFIPQKKITFPMPVKGDGRNVGDKGTSRTTQEILVETDRRKSRDALLEHKKDTGISQGAGVIFIPNPVGGGMVPAPGIVVRKATGDSIKATAEHHKHRDGAVYINAKASESYPGVPSPAIDYDFHINVMDSGNGKITVEMVGQHDGFPAYEVFAVREGDTEEQHIYSHDPRDENQTGLSLAGGEEFKASSRVDLHRPNKKKP